MSFDKKSLKVAQNREQASERASQINQASQAIQESHTKKKKNVVWQKKLESCLKSRTSERASFATKSNIEQDSQKKQVREVKTSKASKAKQIKEKKQTKQTKANQATKPSKPSK